MALPRGIPRRTPAEILATDRAWRAKNKQKLKDRILKYSYGLSLEEYNVLLSGQKGLCCICKVDIQKGPHVDHNHITGEVRGLLCSPCNRGLGAFRDNPVFLIDAASYLMKKPE